MGAGTASLRRGPRGAAGRRRTAPPSMPPPERALPLWNSRFLQTTHARTHARTLQTHARTHPRAHAHARTHAHTHTHTHTAHGARSLRDHGLRPAITGRDHGAITARDHGARITACAPRSRRAVTARDAWSRHGRKAAAHARRAPGHGAGADERVLRKGHDGRLHRQPPAGRRYHYIYIYIYIRNLTRYQIYSSTHNIILYRYKVLKIKVRK